MSNKLYEKHFEVISNFNSMNASKESANITKEISLGFFKWTLKNRYMLYFENFQGKDYYTKFQPGKFGYTAIINEEFLTEEELFEKYINEMK